MNNGKITQAFILAAGLGTRMRELTQNIPKPLLKVNHRPILEYIINNLVEYGVTKIVINSHYLAEQIEHYIQTIKLKYSNVEFQVIYESELLNSGGGVKNALKFLNDQPFFAINGDIIWMNDQSSTLEILNSAWHPDLDCLMLAQPKNLALGYDGQGDFGIEKDDIPSKKIEHQYIFPGIQIYNPKVFNKIVNKTFSAIEIYFNPEFKVKAAVNQNIWLHLGTPENLEQVYQFIKKNE